MSVDHGSCHCGNVEWEVKLGERAHVLCHCDTCKKLSGGAYTLNQIVDKSDLKFTKGEDQLKVYTYTGESGKPVHCYYCSNCTAHPYHHQTALGDKIVIRTSLLDKGKDLPAGAEIFGRVRLPWEVEVAQTFPGAPPS